ncbi:MAG: hypothetical protein KJP01_03640 [Gramella sp.]|nr:hypothetical protein [Christiangramia sp.]MBT8319200.1 hypothetical protein [Christiangramia sp.]
MNYKKLKEDIYFPKPERTPLKKFNDPKFNYFLTSHIDGNSMELEITSKLFDLERTYMKKSCYQINIGDIEDCVKRHIKEHMLDLGIPKKNIPEALHKIKITNRERENKRTA